MAAQKYLPEYYTTKVHTPRADRTIAAPKGRLELQIQGYLLAGNAAYFEGRYAAARQEYLAALALLPKLADPTWPAVSGEVVEGELMAVDLSDSLMEAAVQIAKVGGLVSEATVVTSAKPPPPSLRKLAQRFHGEVGAAGRAAREIEAAAVLAQAGEYEAAHARLDAAERFAVDDPGLRGDIRGARGALRVAERNFDAAVGELQEAAGFYDAAGRRDGVAAVSQNLGVAMTLAGRPEEAAAQFAKAAAAGTQDLGWELTYSTNPGIASVGRKMERGGLPLLMADGQAGWTKLGSVEQARARTTQTLRMRGRITKLDLAAGASEIRSKLLEPRVGAVELADLEVFLVDEEQFVAYLAHVAGFVLPMALGDTYFALRDFPQAERCYLQAREYRYLNMAIERPMVWARLGRTYLQWGHRLYRDNDRDGAMAQYRHLAIRVGPNAFRLSGPLYSGPFAALEAETLGFLEAADRVDHAAVNHERRVLLLEAVAAMDQIASGLSYFGLGQVAPIHSWRYLQTLARYFANQAIQAERAYIGFKSTAEREEFTRLALEQAVDVQDAALKVEDKRLLTATEERRVADLNVAMAQAKETEAAEQRSAYQALGKELIYFDSWLAWAGAKEGRTEVVLTAEVSDSLGLGRVVGNPRYDALVSAVTRKRASATLAYELQTMDYAIRQLGRARQVAEAQREVARKLVDVAVAQRDLARLRVGQAKAQLDFFDAREFTPELWDKLAQAQREISERYLDWAIGAAELMERAFEFAYDREVNLIRQDYQRSELHGLLAGDYLLADIDRFSFERLLETDKRVPAKVVISLADRYPVQFQRQFQQTGRMDFQTLLEDFDRLSPGSHLRKLRRVEVVVEGLVPPEGLHGTLTNSGTSEDRDRDGRRMLRVQPVETMVLSRYTLRGDGFVFVPDEDVLELFENCGPACAWTLELRPDANDVDFGAIADVHLILYFEAFYNQHVESAVRAELAAADRYESTLGIGLLFQFPDEFFSFQDEGEVAFTIDRALLPATHTDARILDLYLIVQTEAGHDPAGLVVTLARAGGPGPVDGTTTAGGMVSTGAGAAPLNAVRGEPLAGTWTIAIDEAKNQARFDAGFGWPDVHNILVVAEYAYTPRGRPLSSDAFEADPMAAFEVVDDPRATVGGPSSWAYDATGASVVQTATVSGPAGVPAGDRGPDKPGTYLVRKTAEGWPALRDLVVRTHLTSGGNGVGLVFRYQDADNFYFFLMDAQRNDRRIGKKVQGVFSDLDRSAFDDTRGYVTGQEHEVAVAVVGNSLKAFVDGVEVLDGRDGSIQAPGRVGFSTWANGAASFADLGVRPA